MLLIELDRLSSLQISGNGTGQNIIEDFSEGFANDRPLTKPI